MVGIGDDIYLDFECIVYPNPTSNMLVINISSFEKEGLLYRLYDSNGKLLAGERITGKESIVKMKNLLPAPYLLKVYDNKRLLRTFKVIKNR